MSDKIILVAGLPSGGTSLVAGVLHHLGVDMGEVATHAYGSRNYLGFECEIAKREFGGLPSDASPDTMLATAQSYFDKRLAAAYGPVGVKLNILILLGQCKGVEALPIKVVHVKRNLEDTFASDIKYTGEDMGRAATRGMLDLGLRQLVRKVSPAAVIEYETSIREPRLTVEVLVAALQLNPTPGQVEAAIAFIDPQACKMERTYKIAVVTPWSSPFMWRKFGMNVANMIAEFRRPNWRAKFFMGEGCDPAGRHCDMILQALAWDADLICIVGADQIHPLDMLDRLIDRYIETGGGVISALVPFRGYVAWQMMKPFQPMGWRIKNDSQNVREFRGMDQDPDMFEPIDPAAGDLQRIDVIGSGVLMFDRDTILALKKPWFYYLVNEDMQRIADMDSKFVWRLREEVQAQVWVDTTIKVQHLHTFEIDETYSDRFADWQTPGVATDDSFKYRMPATAMT